MQAYPQQNVSQFGAQLAVYKPRTGKIILLGMLLILVGLPCTIGSQMTHESYTVYSNSSNSLTVWLLTVGLGCILIGIIALILVLGNRKLRVDMYEQGFVATNKQGGKEEVRWNQITQVWHKLEEIKTTTEKDPKTGESVQKTRKDTSINAYVVQCADGTSCEINTDYYSLSTFAPILEQTYPQYLLPSALASYQTGNPLTFGTLSVSAAGIRNQTSDGNAELPWGGFHTIAVDKQKGGITVQRGGEAQLWSSISVTNTPNIAVFEALVNTIARGQ